MTDRPLKARGRLSILGRSWRPFTVRLTGRLGDIFGGHADRAWAPVDKQTDRAPRLFFFGERSLGTGRLLTNRQLIMSA